MDMSDTRQGACRITRTAARRLTCRRMTLSKSPTPPRTLTVADVHALADHRLMAPLVAPSVRLGTDNGETTP
jgi:hypothetical protein